ncbi:hypothetical protein IFR08_17900 [Pseudomonas fluorescens]|jgi:hypothetical protein|uniref:Uncharacterized protein n=1 Tax=Pseudomonas fluorescens TaxID=294 RepID=A0A2N1ECL0_PSEFL|nr:MULTISPECIES: hypothetical protein [Pseudomonas]RZA21928.1 MAG: hypothetical protein EOP02_16750 [Pseudomonadota bacterium]MBD8099992.1 hypothetical protein [Pseudomonas fluorescens]MBD8775607.1 hypothetical protein [Pseudomonas fluorescens]MBD8781635.1 hypothetical protein [Pseudomonas fluorescens]MBD8796056.1 hypothetical protein [Pseudomonas fluorescens]
MERHHRRINSTKRRKLIAAYKLPGAPGTPATLPLDTEDDCNAAVVNNGVISFAEGLSGLNREYIRKSYLLASRYVSDVLKVQRGTEAWYDEFINVMVSLGWLPLRRSFERVSRAGKGLTVQLAALNIIGAMLASMSLSGPLLSLLPKLAADALEAMKQQPASFDLFKRNSSVHEGGDFGVASCAETNGQVMMVLVTYSSHGVSKQVGLPFLEWDSSSFEAFSGQTCLVLNTSVVNEKTIQLMRDSAGDNVQSAIAKYRI